MFLTKFVVVAIAMLTLISLPARVVQSNTLEIGVLPHLSIRVLLQQYQPMRDFLERELSRPVQILTASDFKSFYQRTAAGEYDIVITAPHFAGLAETRAGYQPMLVFHPEIQGLIITARDRPMLTIEDIRGQALVLPNPKSLVVIKGLTWMAEYDLQPERDFQILTTPNQDSVGDMVLNGDARAAMLSNGEFNSIPDTIRAELQVYEVFTEIPGFTILAQPQMAADTVESICELLLEFAKSSPESQDFFHNINFDGLRRLTDDDREKIYSYMPITEQLLGLTQ